MKLVRVITNTERERLENYPEFQLQENVIKVQSDPHENKQQNKTKQSSGLAAVVFGIYLIMTYE